MTRIANRHLVYLFKLVSRILELSTSYLYSAEPAPSLSMVNASVQVLRRYPSHLVFMTRSDISRFIFGNSPYSLSMVPKPCISVKCCEIVCVGRIATQHGRNRYVKDNLNFTEIYIPTCYFALTMTSYRYTVSALAAYTSF